MFVFAFVIYITPINIRSNLLSHGGLKTIVKLITINSNVLKYTKKKLHKGKNIRNNYWTNIYYLRASGYALNVVLQEYYDVLYVNNCEFP